MNFYNRQSSGFIALGYLVFIVLLVFSILFYLERTCYADVAFQSFLIINTKNVAYQLDRFGAVLIHIFPLCTVLLHLPLKYVLLSYSTAFVLQNLLFFWLLHKVLKQREIALILVLFNVLLVTETFYWTTNEIKQGFSFCILFSGIIRAMPIENYDGLKKYSLLFFYLGILITTILLHNLVVFAVVFILGFEIFMSWKIPSKTVMWIFAMIIAILLVKYFLFPVSWYESEKYELRQNFITFFPNYFGLPSFRHFVAYCWHDWYLYSLMLMSVVVFYIWNRMWLKLGWVLLFTIGYLVMVNVTHPVGLGKPFVESFLQALPIFVLYPFVIDMLPRLRYTYALAILLMIFILRLNTIYNAHHSYTIRLNLIRETLASNKGKFIVPEDYYPSDKLKMPWGAPYESALLTSMVSPDSCRSFVILKDTTQFKYADLNNDYIQHIYAPFGSFSYKELNPAYFRPLPGKYRVLSKTEYFHTQP